MKKKALIVDIDNTLIDTAFRKISLLKELYSFEDNEISLEEIRKDYWLSSYLGDSSSKIYDNFFRKLDSQEGILNHSAPVFPGAILVLNWAIEQEIEIIFLSILFTNGINFKMI